MTYDNKSKPQENKKINEQDNRTKKTDYTHPDEKSNPRKISDPDAVKKDHGKDCCDDDSMKHVNTSEVKSHSAEQSK